jgi:hypothetical protein
MTSSAERRPNYARRFVWLLVGIVVVIVGYTGAWHYAAGAIVDRFDAAIARANSDGRRANCENAEVRGYPFRIGVFCQSVLFEDARAGIGVRARALRSAAQVYAPQRVIAELDGPATIQVPGISAIDIGWSTLRASIKLATPLPERLSIEGSDVRVAFDEPGEAAPPLGRARSAEIHMRPAGNDLDLAARFTGLELEQSATGGGFVPPLSGVIDVSVKGGMALMLAGVDQLRGQSGTIRDLTVSLDAETGATVRGTASVDEAGLLDAELEITLRNPRALSRVLGDLLPESRQQIELGLSALGSGGNAATLPLRVIKGEVSLGFLSLGSIPPL